MVGFPTETMEEFKETLELIINQDFSSGSIFIYSEREGTDSEKIFPKVSKENILKETNYASEYLKQNGYKCSISTSKIAVVNKLNSKRLVKDKLMYISFCTTGTYEGVVNKYLLPSLIKLKLPHKIYKRDNLHDWNKNTRMKAGVILEALGEFPNKDVCFIDSDNVIKSFPELFYRIPKEYDLALFWLDWFLHWRNRPGNSKRELLSGVALFRNNEKVKTLIREWMVENQKPETGYEQKILQDLLKKYPEIKVFNLPVEYCVVPAHNGTVPSYIKKPVIYAYPFSRVIRKGDAQV